MSRRDRGERLADLMQWGGGFATFIVTIVVTWLIAVQYGEIRGYQESQTENFASAYSNTINRACAGFSGPELVRCSFEVQKSIEESKTTEHDLQAQREVARYTHWLMWFGFFGLGVTGFGLYYLNENIAEMKRSRVLSELDRRAWIAVDIDEVEVTPSVHSDGYSFEWKYTLKNEGKSVALDVRPITHVFKSDYWFAHSNAVDHFTSDADAFRKQNSGRPIFPNSLIQYSGASANRTVSTIDPPSNEKMIFVALVVIYRTDGLDVTHTTTNIYECTPSFQDDTKKNIFLRVQQKHT